MTILLPAVSIPSKRMPIAPELIPGVWRGHRRKPLAPTESTGSRSLDDALQGGWPQSALTEIVGRYKGFGFSLILPTLAKLTAEGKAVALVNTPYIPYAPALDSRGIVLDRLLWIRSGNDDEALWAVEQLLRSGLMAAVAFWSQSELDGHTERRLQLAAETTQSLVFAFRSGSVEGPSYAALKLAAGPSLDGQTQVEVLKCRGGRAGRRFGQPFALPRAARFSA
jgi:hypothetical protein